MATTWLITREADDAREEREAALARGQSAVVVPCVETLLLPWPFAPAPTASLSLRSGERSGEGPTVHPIRAPHPGPLHPGPLPAGAGRGSDFLTFFTSRRAVASWTTSGKPALGAVAALSPATSSSLDHEGITPIITATGGVVSLAEAVLAWWSAQGSPPTHIHYPTSDFGLRASEQTEALRLLAQVGEVDRRESYRITAPAGLRESLEQRARGDWAISFASPSAVQHFFASGALFTNAPGHVACLGAATERAWNRARPEGWPQAVNSRVSSPNPEVTS